jgi:uncharacterized membrane protein YhhN
MSVLLPVLYVVCALIHLTAACLDRERLRQFTKVCLLPLLVGYYAAGAGRFLPFVVLAGLLGWMGDIVLIRISKRRNLILGLTGFLLGHIFYILSICFFIQDLNYTVLAIALAISAPLVAGIFLLVRPEKSLRLPVIIYEIVIMGMAISALLLLLYRRDLPGISVFAGSLCFIASDTILAYFTFRTFPRFGNVAVMLPYIIAQYCLIAGLAHC